MLICSVRWPSKKLHIKNMNQLPMFSFSILTKMCIFTFRYLLHLKFISMVEICHFCFSKWLSQFSQLILLNGPPLSCIGISLIYESVSGFCTAELSFNHCIMLYFLYLYVLISSRTNTPLFCLAIYSCSFFQNFEINFFPYQRKKNPKNFYWNLHWMYSLISGELLFFLIWRMCSKIELFFHLFKYPVFPQQNFIVFFT